MKSTIGKRMSVSVLLSAFALLSLSASSFAADLSNYVGKFTLAENQNIECPTEVAIDSTENANDIAFALWTAVRVELPEYYKAKALIRSSEISQTLTSQYYNYKMTWAVADQGMLMTAQIDYANGNGTEYSLQCLFKKQ